MFSLSLPLSSFSIENGENSEKRNHMLSATSHVVFEFLTKFVNMSKLQNALYQRVPLHNSPARVFCINFESDLDSTLFFTPKTSSTELSSSKTHVVLIKNSFSTTALDFQFAAKENNVLDETSFQQKNYGKKKTSILFFTVRLGLVNRH